MSNQALEFHPPIGPDRRVVDAPITQVTLFEDRARVLRRLSIALPEGQSRLVIPSVAPVLQDVSVRATVVSDRARVADAGVRRSLRVRRAEKPAAVRALDEALLALSQRLEASGDIRRRTEARLALVTEMLRQGAAEIPQDVAWGIADPERWGESFSALFSRAKDLREAVWAEHHAQEDLAEDIRHTLERRRLAARRDDDVVAWIALDIVADAPQAGDPQALVIEVEYVVPCALWRPLHSARLVDGARMVFSTQAAIWQNTGEDWDQVALVCSTARASLGVEPPLLSDDLLAAQKKPEETVVAAREVELQRASVDGAPAERVELPGVDDGGDIQALRVPGAVSVPANGRPCFLPLLRFEAPAEVHRVLMAELSPAVFLKSTQPNAGRHPILAGPVELIRDSGLVGWTRTLFVAPGERFELGYGPQDDMRVTRRQRPTKETIDPVEETRRQDSQVDLYLSNLADQPQTVQVTERVPVSEVTEVTVEIREKTPAAEGPAVDRDGLAQWTVTLGPYQRAALRLRYRLSIAPGVEGL